MTTENQTIKVLDKGYVRLVDVLGSDLSVANAFPKTFVSWDRNDI